MTTPAFLLTALLLLLSGIGAAQISWPAGQVLPSFPRPAPVQDLVVLGGSAGLEGDELYLFSSLKGIVNHTQPRIFAYEGNDGGEGRYTWLESLGLDYVEHSDPWALMDKYHGEVAGLIVYDPEQLHTVNLATMLAGERGAVIASPRLAERLGAAPYRLPVLEDLRGRFSSKLAVYETLYEQHWQDKDRRLLVGISPTIIKSAIREYAVALALPTVWLDPEVAEESELLDKFLGSMAPDGHYLGWWPEEAPGITRASSFGIPTIPSDFSSNLTVHGGFDRTIRIKPAPPVPALENKIYVAFILSDGDNLQFVEHALRKIWSDPGRGSVPLGWTVSPAMRDAMPGALNYYYDSATDNDNLISGPSGLGYIYPNFYPDGERLAEYVRRTEAYNRSTGLRVTTVWNTITGGVDARAGKTYARYAPSLLGLTAQNTGGPLSIYRDSLPVKPLTCNYCWDEENMGRHIAQASEGWDGKEPRFLIIQSQPWKGATPTTFRRVADELGPEYRVVRPDHLFLLLREQHGLAVPGAE
ncbi:GxGYxYP domain-containing protein [Lewinella sp. IMCC34183]|uniref:GxGYxYP domain-containing protein n=1 Tax=Lewinella sp. IMCC34183 TaxID=2248762 RepID=UPI000E26DCF1|nr:GxGYxYP domain-containing protein [Lewinella sp. IMCC34183]